MRKVILSFISTALVLSSVSASASTKINLSDSVVGISITENREILTDGPNLMAQTDTKDGERFYLCKTAKDEICLAARNVRATTFLPPCDAQNSINCISSFFATDESGKRTEGTFVKFVDLGSEREFEADAAMNLPQGKGHGGTRTLPGIKRSTGGENYYLGSLLTSWAPVDSASKKYSESFYPQSLVAGISPVTTKVGEYGTTTPSDSNHKSNDGSPNGGVGSGNTSRVEDWSDCVVTEPGNCYMADEFPSGYRFGLTLKLGRQLKGWFHGRIYQPQISIAKNEGTTQIITIDALPVLVPIVKEKVATASLSSELRTFLENTEVGNGFGYVMPGSSGDDAFMQTKM